MLAKHRKGVFQAATPKPSYGGKQTREEEVQQKLSINVLSGERETAVSRVVFMTTASQPRPAVSHMFSFYSLIELLVIFKWAVA